MSIGSEHVLYPFSALQGGAVIDDTVATRAVTVFDRDATLSALDAAYIAKSRRVPSASAWFAELDGNKLTFTREGDAIIDFETRSEWNLLGQAARGRYEGRRLEPAPSGVHFAFAWLAFNSDSRIQVP